MPNTSYRDDEDGSNSNNEDDYDNDNDNQNDKPNAPSAPRSPDNRVLTPPPTDESWALHMFSPIDPLGHLDNPMDTNPFDMNTGAGARSQIAGLDNIIAPVMIYLTPLVCCDL